ncbi:MAG: 6-phosphofructokinase [Blastocatellia bacterium AA13]|nr:MAG: 6-phosphofructokinase [Blastocatellia bacterium AA13]
MEKYIGVLTGGGDCPGLNAAIRGVVRRALIDDIRVLGIHSGWQGLISGRIEPLTRYSVAGLQYKGGTILGTSRCNPLTSEEWLQKIHENWRKFGLGALIVVGGNGTLSCAAKMWSDHKYPIVGIPKTIDNDVPGTDYTFGFDTAVSIATEAIDRLHTTAEAHHRVMVVEVMGRHTGWIATCAGIAGGADLILIPERPFRLSEICEMLVKRREEGRPFSIIVVAEDSRPHPDEDFLTSEQHNRIYREEHLGGIGQLVARKIEERINISTRITVLGYIQRGGSPTAYDRVLATRLGVQAVEMVIRSEFGMMAALRGTKTIGFPLEEAANKTKTVDPDLFKTAEVFFG